jgi:hypothetical protein
MQDELKAKEEEKKAEEEKQKADKSAEGEALLPQNSNRVSPVVEKKAEVKKKEEDDDDELYEIEYNVVNMPGLIQKNPKRFMALIQEYSDRDITFLEIPVI